MTDNNLLPDWEDKNKVEKILSIISIILGILIIITILITLITKYNLYLLYYPCLFIFLIIQGISYWKYNKFLSIIEFICSIIFLLTFILMLIK